MNTYESLPFISRLNPDITHFLLRVYKKTNNAFIDEKGSFEYEWIPVWNIDSIKERMNDWEGKGCMVGLTSMVMTEQGIKSLILLDFSMHQSEDLELKLLEKIRIFNRSGDASYKMDGYLIKTNSSYHYLGKYVTSVENFYHFLGSSLLFRHSDEHHFIVDDRWLGHQMKRGYGTIRIGHKDVQDYPKVIAEI